MILTRHIFTDELLTDTLLNQTFTAAIEDEEIGILELDDDLIAPDVHGIASGSAETWTMIPNRAQQMGAVTLTQNLTLTFDGLEAGMWGALVVTQDGTGGWTLTISPTPKTTTTLITSTANAIDLLEWAYDGTDLFIWPHKNCT